MSDLLDRFKSALADRYTIGPEIGRGGMAVVFRAEDLRHSRQVAIKVLQPELTATLGVERFLREIEIAAGLDHPNILTLLDSGQAAGLLYYVMPYAEGESLRSRLEREGQLPIDEAVRIVREVADGLAHAHRRGVIHRDIKPANIMLSEGHALIADFGIARAVGGDGQALTSTGLAVGTPAYMSPEQASGGQVEARTDLYALGCVLYEMLAGLPPLTGPTPQATAAMRLTETATALPVIRDTVPQGLNRVALRLLSKSPADRYATAEKLMDALERPELWADGKPARHSWKFVGTATVALTAVAGGIFAIWSLAMRSGGDSRRLVPQRVAVLPFENRTEEPSFDYLGRTVAERITTRLQREGAGEVVSVASVDAAIRNGATSDQVRTVGEATGAAIVVNGAITRRADSLVFATRVADPVGGTMRGSFELPVSSLDVPDPALEEIASRLAGGLLLAFWGEEPESSFRSYPRVEAYWKLREGIALHRDGKHGEALDRYRDSAGLDSTFRLPLDFAMGATNSLRMYETEDSLIRVIERRFRSGMSEIERHRFDAHRAFYDRDLEAAYRAARRALISGARDWEAWQEMALFCFATNRPQEALEALREGEGRLGTDVSQLAFHQFYVVQASHMLGHYERELETAEASEQLNVRNPAQTKYFVGRAAAALGRVDDVRRVQGELLGLADSTGLGAWHVAMLALELRYNGFREEAREAMERSVRWLEDRPGWQARRLSFGILLYYAERWTESQDMLQSLEQGRPDDYRVVGYLGLLAARRGDGERAAGYSAQLERIADEDYGVRPIAWAMRARIAALLGMRVDAVSHLKRAFDEGLLYWRLGTGPYQYPFDFEGMADYEPYQELLRPKG